MSKLVIFDCDPILVDSEHLAIKVDVEFLASLGWEITAVEATRRFVGLSMEQIGQMIESEIGRELPHDWQTVFNQRLRERFASELRPVEGILKALDAIQHEVCVASSGSHEKIQHSLTLTGLYERFKGRIFSASEVAQGKPAPDLFLHVAQQMGTPPGQCIVVEDSVPGVLAALAADMSVLAYSGSVTPAADLNISGATLFDDMGKLPKLIERL